jgi:parvulin-like peptidyl-prolyl isomerase
MGFVSMRRNFGKHMRTVLYVIFAIFLVSCFYYFGAYTTGPAARREGRGGGGGVVATVNGDKIPRAVFDAQFERQYQQYDQMGMASLATLEMLRWNVLDGLIQRQLLLASAKQQGVEVSRRDLNKEMDRIIAETIKSRGATQNREYRRLVENSVRGEADNIRNDMMIQRLQQTVESQIKATDEDVRNSYKEVRARHILIRVDPTGKAGLPDDKAKQKAEEILAKLKGGGDFAALAKEFSDDKVSAEKGGDLGYFGAGQMPAFEKAAFALKPGAMSGIVKTPYGYHIIKVEDERYNLPKDFDQKKADYRKQYVQQQGARVWQELMRTLRSQAKVEIKDPELRAAQARMEGKNEEALADYNKAVETGAEAGDQVRAAVYYTLGDLYGERSDWKKAAAMYEKSLDVAGGSLQEIYVALGQAYEKLGNKPKALEYLKAAEDEAPDDYGTRQRLLTAYEALGDSEGAARQKTWIDEQTRKYEEEQKKRAEELAQQQAAEAQKKAGSQSAPETGSGSKDTTRTTGTQPAGR